MVTKKSWAYANREFLGQVAYKVQAMPVLGPWKVVPEPSKEYFRRIGEEVADATLGKFNKEFRALLAQPPKPKPKPKPHSKAK